MRAGGFAFFLAGNEGRAFPPIPRQLLPYRPMRKILSRVSGTGSSLIITYSRALGSPLISAIVSLSWSASLALYVVSH